MLTFLCMEALSFIEPKALGMGHSSIEELLLSLIYDWRVLLVLFGFKFWLSTATEVALVVVSLCPFTNGGFAGWLFRGWRPATMETRPHTGAMAIIGMGSFLLPLLALLHVHHDGF